MNILIAKLTGVIIAMKRYFVTIWVYAYIADLFLTLTVEIFRLFDAEMTEHGL